MPTKALQHQLFEAESEFFHPGYQQHNQARLQHLASLELDLEAKSVLELGAGVGDHTQFYLTRNCDILPTDGRPELVDYIQDRFGIPALCLNLEAELDKLAGLGKFDVVHAYGILYHLANPADLLRVTAPIGKILLLESCVCGDELPNYALQEPAIYKSQSISGQAFRLNRRWIYDQLKALYPHVYMPISQPDHPEFPLSWHGIEFQHDTLIRAIYIASHEPLHSTQLKEEFLTSHVRYQC